MRGPPQSSCLRPSSHSPTRYGSPAASACSCSSICLPVAWVLRVAALDKGPAGRFLPFTKSLLRLGEFAEREDADAEPLEAVRTVELAKVHDAAHPAHRAAQVLEQLHGRAEGPARRDQVIHEDHVRAPRGRVRLDLED